jgi:hypothetical protein
MALRLLSDGGWGRAASKYSALHNQPSLSGLPARDIGCQPSGRENPIHRLGLNPSGLCNWNYSWLTSGFLKVQKSFSPWLFIGRAVQATVPI